MICPVCNRSFVQSRWNKRFCRYACHARSESLVHAKELFRLSKDDLRVRERLRVGV